jgi:hypothetical protein
LDIHQVIASVVEEVLHGVSAANKELAGKARVGEPTSIEIEFGITSTYEIANYDDVRVATASVRLPLFHGEQAPATATVAAEKKPEKSDKSKK